MGPHSTIEEALKVKLLISEANGNKLNRKSSRNIMHVEVRS
jgi:hypothetical protein